MAATRLALSMDESVVERARKLAVARNTSISRLFVSFVCMMEQTSAATDGILPPLTKRALGSVRELRSCMPHSTAKKKKLQNTKIQMASEIIKLMVFHSHSIGDLH